MSENKKITKSSKTGKGIKKSSDDEDDTKSVTKSSSNKVPKKGESSSKSKTKKSKDHKKSSESDSETEPSSKNKIVKKKPKKVNDDSDSDGNEDDVKEVVKRGRKTDSKSKSVVKEITQFTKTGKTGKTGKAGKAGKTGKAKTFENKKKSLKGKGLKSKRGRDLDDDDSDVEGRKFAHDDDEQNSNRVLMIKTTHTGAFKQMIERISNVASDCCMTFMQSTENSADNEYYREMDDITNRFDSDNDEDDEDDDKSERSKSKKSEKSEKTGKVKPLDPEKSGGIRIFRLTEERNILIKVQLYASAFDYFRCDEPTIVTGIDMHSFHVFLKSINDDGGMVIYMNRQNPSVLYVNGLNDDNEEIELAIDVIDIVESVLPIPSKKFEHIIFIPAEKFHNICKNMYNNATLVEIMAVNGEIFFKAQNDSGKISITYHNASCPNKKKAKKNSVYREVFELRNIMNFSKCNKLCDEVQVYLKNNYPMVLSIPVADLGKMYVFVTSIDAPVS